MKIGLSLSTCVRHIMDGSVKLQDVVAIVTNTCAYNEDRWSMLLDSYCDSFWHKDPEQAREIVSYLRGMGRIVQPRVDNPDYRHLSRSVWIDVPSA